MPTAGQKGAGISFPTLWADRPGASIGVALVRSAAARVEGGPRARADAPIKLTLGAPGSAAVQVLGPTGQPVEGARVSPVYFEWRERELLVFGSIYHLAIPGEIANRLAVRTDAQGVAKVAGLPSGGLGYTRVEAPRFGTQTVMLQGKRSGPLEARLGAVGRLVGKVKGDDPAAAHGLRVRVETHPKPPSLGHPFVYSPSGAAEAIIDTSGQFEVPALAAGMLSLSLRTRDDKLARDLPPRTARSKPARPPS